MMALDYDQPDLAERLFMKATNEPSAEQRVGTLSLALGLMVEGRAELVDAIAAGARAYLVGRKEADRLAATEGGRAMAQGQRRDGRGRFDEPPSWAERFCLDLWK
jgi:hypothetical protein